MIPLEPIMKQPVELPFPNGTTRATALRFRNRTNLNQLQLAPEPQFDGGVSTSAKYQCATSGLSLHEAGNSPNRNIRVLLSQRPEIRSLLLQIHEVELVAVVNSEKDLAHTIAEYLPQVIVFAIDDAGSEGLSLITHLLKRFPTAKAVIKGHSLTPEFVRQALRAGVSGVLPDQPGASDLKGAIKAAVAGKTLIDPGHHLDQLHGAKTSSALPIQSPLTPRQREVLELIASGKTTKEIAGMIRVSPKTVEAHRTQLMKRLGIHNIPALVRYALRIGLAHLETT
jgi:DNA-binding NarL/FixJ family response regulator